MVDEHTDPPKRRNDRAVSLILIVIWGIGLLSVATLQPQIPKSMLVIGTVFFVVLIPAMKDLVRSLERKTSEELNEQGSDRSADS